jgi:hypothetical protein
MPEKFASPPLGSVEPHAQMLTTPQDGQLLYKMMTVENLLRSVAGNYLHFNRVDAYSDFPSADKNDGRQLPLDQPSNADVKFERDSNYSLANYYDQSRARTYACCFSMENSDHIWSTYATGSVKGKACVVFNFGKLRRMLSDALQPGNAALEYEGIRCHQVFSINYGIVKYVDWNSCRTNIEQATNPITYTYLKDKSYADEKELRISLSAVGLGQFALNDGRLIDFPDNLQMAFDFRAAIANKTIQRILLAPDAETDFLSNELAKLRITPHVED